MSLYPPHLIASKGSLTPAALIPFCAYQTNMTLLGQTRQDLPFTVCSQFQPTVLEGQLCYSLNKNLAIKAGEGLDNGLLLIIDQGNNYDVHQGRRTAVNSKTNVASLKLTPPDKKGDKRPARVYLNTLAKITASKAGSYNLFGLKRLTGTNGFMAAPDEIKECQVETYYDCYVRNFMMEVQNKCGCVPWVLSSVDSTKMVNMTAIPLFY